jgi:DNA-binding NarL/FixJ family response regulator
MAFTKPTVVLADDSEPMLERLSSLLRPSCQVVAAVENGALAIDAVLQYRPDLAVLDVSMPQMSGIDAARRMRELELQTKIVLMSVHISPDYIDIARSLTASYVLKNHLHSEILHATAETLAGRLFYSAIPVVNS